MMCFPASSPRISSIPTSGTFLSSASTRVTRQLDVVNGVTGSFRIGRHSGVLRVCTHSLLYGVSDDLIDSERNAGSINVRFEPVVRRFEYIASFHHKPFWAIHSSSSSLASSFFSSSPSSVSFAPSLPSASPKINSHSSLLTRHTLNRDIVTSCIFSNGPPF